MKLIIHTDGGARGNPGPAAIGVVIEEELPDKSQKTLIEFGKRIGNTTNNVAEYTAVIEAYAYLKEAGLKPESIAFYLDSALVVNQLKGLFRVKEIHLQKLHAQVGELVTHFSGSITYTAVPREQNTRADYFVNDALDNR